MLARLPPVETTVGCSDSQVETRALRSLQVKAIHDMDDDCLDKDQALGSVARADSM